MSTENTYVRNEVEVVAKVYASGRVLGRRVANDDVVTLPCDTEAEARAIGKALRANLVVDHVELVHRTLRITERTGARVSDQFRGASFTGSLRRPVVALGQLQVVFLPHVRPVAVVDIGDYDLRLGLDQWAHDTQIENRDDAVLQLVFERLAQLGYPHEEATRRERLAPALDDRRVGRVVKSLDHSWCATYSLDEFHASHETCRSMHCPDCGKRTGGQGHINCPERTPETQREADRRGSFIHWALDAVNREAEASEEL